MKDFVPVIAALVLAVGIVVAAQNMSNDSVGSGQVPGVNLYPQAGLENQIDLPVATNYNLQHFEAGSTVFSSASSSTTTLPAARDGLVFTFQVNEAIATGNWIIDSTEGDNINGTLSVNNADVACSGEDQLNFVTDGETIGDFVTLRSDGDQWVVSGSDVETAAKLTCTDPN